MLSFFPSRTVAIELFGFSVHWYGLLYLAAFLIAWVLLPKLQKYRQLSLSDDEWSGLLSSAVLGVILGGRLGFIVFYEPAYFLQHPLEMLKVWHGGMSSHGGFLGVTAALLFALRDKTTDDKLRIADVAVVPIALGLMLGRLGNFINQELYGTVTSLPWGIAIPGVEDLRHPTQLYAMGKDLLIASLCFLHLRSARSRSGETCALFLILYAVLRMTVEAFREQDYGASSLFGVLSVTRGQLLSIPILLVGLGLLWTVKRKAAATH